MCEFCQGYRQAARDLSHAERTGTPQATPCPYPPEGAQWLPWVSGYMKCLDASDRLAKRLDDPTPDQRWKYGHWLQSGYAAAEELCDVLRAAREGDR